MTWYLHLQINISWSDALTKHVGVQLDLGLIDLRFAKGKGLLAMIVYEYHRLAHKIPFLWQLHNLHHMDPELDVLTINRDN